MAVTYPEDRTGTLASNKITGEIQVLTPVNNRNFQFIIPKFAPFYEDGFKIFQHINGTLLELQYGIDYYFCYRYESASLSTAKNLWGGISFINLALAGELELEYQTLGGQWTLDEQQILEIVANEVYNPRGRTWDQVNGKPEVFGPTSHIQDASDFLTEQQVGEKLDDISEAILGNANRPIQTPPVTLEDLGIPKIGNWGMATIQQAIDGLAADSIISPLTLHSTLAHLGILDSARDMQDFRNHVNDHNNPHENTKETIRLGKVENRGVADEENVIGNKDDEGLVTLTQLRKFIRTHGCQTAPETEVKFPEKGSVQGYRCTSNYDRIAILADGMGHTYEKVIEPNSITCGYQPPQKNNFPPHGTVLQYYCLDYDRWKIVADGYGGSYHAFVMANSADCGYSGGGSTTYPPAGSLLSAHCDGTVLVQTLANGSGGSYENRVPGHPDCANNVSYPPRGTLVSTFCENKNEVGKYTDGAGGYYNEVIVQNSSKCGYVAPTTSPPLTNPPYGTPMGTGCEGTTFVNKFANGSGGTYSEVVEYNSSRCGYQPVTTTTTTTRAPGSNPSLTYRGTHSYITPAVTKETHTVTLTDGQPNTTYFGTFWNRVEGNTQCVGNYFRMTTNAMGAANYSIDVPGNPANPALTPDGIYNSWVELRKIEGSAAADVTSNTIVRVFSGYGLNSGNRTIAFGIYGTQITPGSFIWYTMIFTGFQPNENIQVEMVMRPVTPGFKEYVFHSYNIRNNGSGYSCLTFTPAAQGVPNGMPAPHPWMPDGNYYVYVRTGTSRSGEGQITAYTGSQLSLQNSVFA